MSLVILPAGLHPIGLGLPSDLPPIPLPPVIAADGVSEKTKDFASMLYGADPTDEQVFLAVNILRGSGAAVMNDGQRFQDIRKLTDNAPTLIEQEARTALARLVRYGDITIERIDVETSSPDTFGNCTITYINNRLPIPKKRSIKLPLRPEATST